MAVFAEIISGEVANVAKADATSNLQAGEWVQIDTLNPVPGIGWSYAGGVFTAPAAPTLTLAQQAARLLSGGLTVTSTGTPAISGTYACDATTIGFIQAEIISILKNGTFADGTTSLLWPDISGALHTLTVVEAETIFTDIGAFVAGARKCIIGAPGAALPSATVTIA